MILHRLVQTAEMTLGQLAGNDGQALGVTLELPWKDNQHGVSCIPAGTYTCQRYLSPKRGYDVWLLEHVPGRDAIEIHIGNIPANTDGCILVGERFGLVGDVHGILESGEAFRRLMEYTRAVDTLTLQIVDPSADVVAG